MDDALLEQAVEAIQHAARTGDGKIFVGTIEQGIEAWARYA